MMAMVRVMRVMTVRMLMQMVVGDAWSMMMMMVEVLSGDAVDLWFVAYHSSYYCC